MARQATRRKAAPPNPAPRAPERKQERKTHVVKCWPSSFEAIAAEFKTGEIRQNDRDYQVGDEILMQEYVPYTKTEVSRYTQRELRVDITHIVPWSELQKFGLTGDGVFVLMGIKLKPDSLRSV